MPTSRHSAKFCEPAGTSRQTNTLKLLLNIFLYYRISTYGFSTSRQKNSASRQKIRQVGKKFGKNFSTGPIYFLPLSIYNIDLAFNNGNIKSRYFSFPCLRNLTLFKLSSPTHSSDRNNNGSSNMAITMENSMENDSIRSRHHTRQSGYHRDWIDHYG